MKLNMTEKNWLQAFAIALMIAVCCSCSSKHETVNAKLDSVVADSSFADTVGNKYSADAQLFEVTREYNLTIDSLQILRGDLNKAYFEIAALKSLKDSIEKASISNREKLAIAEYKLLRIREYNRIAAQGNNLKFLRGWILRTLK